MKQAAGWTVLLLLVALNARGCFSSKAEDRLFRKLFRRYNQFIRPVENVSDPVTVEFEVSISQLVKVDEVNQIMETNLWLRHIWNDYKLRWTPAEFDGIEFIRVPSNKIWRPDIVLYNNAVGDFLVEDKTKALLKFDGTITWVPPAIFKSSCPMDITYFPFDYQNCSMKFGSWTYDKAKIDLVLIGSKVNLKDFWESGEWEIIDAPGYKHDIKYNCLLVFYLPSDCGEKVTLCISVLLSLTVFLLVITETIPSTSLVIPLIGEYLLFTMIFVTLSIVITVFVLNVHYRTPMTHTMPGWVHLVFLKVLPRIMLMRRPIDEDAKAGGLDTSGEAGGAGGGGGGAGGGKGGRRRKNSLMQLEIRKHHNADVQRGCLDIWSQSLVKRRDDQSRTGGGPMAQRAGGGGREKRGNMDIKPPLSSSSSLSRSLQQVGGASLNCLEYGDCKRSSMDGCTGKKCLCPCQHGRETPETAASVQMKHQLSQQSINTVVFSVVSPEISQAIESVKYIAENMRSRNKAKEVEDDWKYVAMVIDRIFLWVFVTVCVLGTMGLFLQPLFSFFS
ncbi:hypothetical protein OJAV_G00000970 [Oryzias javanicus]|uniref:Neurotransmitter-gated ion-channel ligand-binding domain-containing protein n=1 Tax=Oryzias javanicus TaxID=123683 RepID=A0A3S2PH57_ORYJA|nr:hypothetical protein OJAV_G00000970 [Oryzias javanicus]